MTCRIDLAECLCSSNLLDHEEIHSENVMKTFSLMRKVINLRWSLGRLKEW